MILSECQICRIPDCASVLTFCFECFILLPSLHQEIFAGGLEPDEVQVRMWFLPVDRGTSAPDISTVRGPTATLLSKTRWTFNLDKVKIDCEKYKDLVMRFLLLNNNKQY